MRRATGAGGRGGAGATGRRARSTICTLHVWRRCWWKAGMTFTLAEGITVAGENWRQPFLAWREPCRLITGRAKGRWKNAVKWLLWLSSLLSLLFLEIPLLLLLGWWAHSCQNNTIIYVRTSATESDSPAGRPSGHRLLSG